MYRRLLARRLAARATQTGGARCWNPLIRSFGIGIKAALPAEGPGASARSQTPGSSLIQFPDITLNNARCAIHWKISSSIFVRRRPRRRSCPVTPHLTQFNPHSEMRGSGSVQRVFSLPARQQLQRKRWRPWAALARLKTLCIMHSSGLCSLLRGAPRQMLHLKLALVCILFSFRPCWLEGEYHEQP